jgi:Beta protein
VQYTPIVKADPTCLLAVARSISRPSLTPLLVFDNEDIAQLRVRATRLRFADHYLAVDIRADARQQHLRALDQTFEPLTLSGARCRPVISIDDDPVALRDVGAWAAATGSDLVLRLRVFSLGARERIQQAMVLASASTRTPRHRIHVLLDQADDPNGETAGALVRLLAENGPWASITIAAGSAPAMSSVTRRGEWIRAERRELRIVNTLGQLGDLGTPLGIGDYTNRHPLLEANLTHARGNGFRWTASDDWYVLREPANGGAATMGVRRDGLQRLTELGALVTEGPRSWGERSITRFVHGEAEADQINAWMINHHIELTADDIAGGRRERVVAAIGAGH